MGHKTGGSWKEGGSSCEGINSWFQVEVCHLHTHHMPPKTVISLFESWFPHPYHGKNKLAWKLLVKTKWISVCNASGPSSYSTNIPCLPESSLQISSSRQCPFPLRPLFLTHQAQSPGVNFDPFSPLPVKPTAKSFLLLLFSSFHCHHPCSRHSYQSYAPIRLVQK